jgi:hypothetical protein
MWSDKTPDAPAFGAAGSGVAVRVASRRGLAFDVWRRYA